MTVTLRCTYPGTEVGPTEVSFEPHPSLGSTLEHVQATIQALIEMGVFFDAPTADGELIPVHPETVERLDVA